MSATQDILDEVHEERRRQNAKWGPVPYDPRMERDDLSDFSNMLDRMREQNEGEDATFVSVLLEEVFEAIIEDDPEKFREELIQVAAVAVKTVEHIDRGTQHG